MKIQSNYDVNIKALLADVKSAGMCTLNNTTKRAGVDVTYKVVRLDVNLYQITSNDVSCVTGTIREIAAWVDGAIHNLQHIANLYPCELGNRPK